jgi:hypothetical protein
MVGRGLPRADPGPGLAGKGLPGLPSRALPRNCAFKIAEEQLCITNRETR